MILSVYAGNMCTCVSEFLIYPRMEGNAMCTPESAA